MKTPRVVLAAALTAAFLGALAAAEKSSATMTGAATRFLAGLSSDQRQQATFPFDGAERTNWHYIPRERKGLPLKQMADAQRALARDLLKSGLSQRGYLTATAIMDLETILGDLEQRTNSSERRIVRDPELYFFSVFGAPSARDAWGWRVEGHHISLNFTVVNGTLVAGTPSFFGTNPAEVPDGPKKGMRILAQEEDAGRALLLALDPAQRAKATIEAAAPNDIVTTNKVKADPLSPVGVPAREMTAAQRDLLMRLVEVYTSSMASDIAADRMAKIKKAGADTIAFAWAGGAEHGQKHYYRVQGPSFLIEYDNTQNDANHIHSVWRDFDGDFGRDLLREHVKSTPHP
jgi:Protein of unknown function (DUF3500)